MQPTQPTTAANKNGIIIYARASGRVKIVNDNQKARINLYAINNHLTVCATHTVTQSLANKTAIIKPLLDAIIAAKAQNATLVFDSFSRIGRTQSACIDFVRIADANAVQWHSLSENLTNDSPTGVLLDVSLQVQNDYKNRANIATANAIDIFDKQGTFNLVATHQNRIDGAMVRKVNATPPVQVIQHIETLFYTTQLSYNDIANICNDIAINDKVFAVCAPYHKQKIKRIYDRHILPKTSKKKQSY